MKKSILIYGIIIPVLWGCVSRQRSPSGEAFSEDPPSPIIVIEGNAFYSDEQGSRIDPELYKRNEESRRSLREFLDEVIRLSDASRASDEASQILNHWLGVWAKANALSQVTSQQAGFERKWILAGLAISYWRAAPHAGWKNSTEINRWLHYLAQTMMEDYKGFERNSQKNNHVYWAGLVAIVSGVNSSDKNMLNWGLEKIRFGLSQVTPEGYLPLELDRGSRALQYHRVSIEALLMSAYFARLQGVDLFKESSDALERLATRIIDGYENPEIFEAKTGVKQEFNIKDSTTWLAIYETLKPGNLRVRKILNTYPAAKNRFLGGDISKVIGSHKSTASCQGIL